MGRARTSLVLLALGAAPLAAQQPLRGSEVTLTVGGDGSVIARERFDITPDSARPAFRVLERSCTAVGAAAYRARLGDVHLRESHRGPWRELLLDTAVSPPAAGWPRDFDVEYVAWLRSGGSDVPLVVPARAIPATSGERPVTLIVDLEQVPGARVTFPAMERHARNQWRARLVAMPSYVRVAWPPGTPRLACGDAAQPARDDGGLGWRTAVFIGVMALWVPLYLAWARRTRDEEAA